MKLTCKSVSFAMALLVAALLLENHDFAIAQSKSTKSRSSSKSSSARGKTSKTIDVRAEKLEADFLREAAGIARDYEQAGDLEKSKSILQLLIKVGGDLPVVKNKIREIDESLLDSNDFQIELDVRKGWGTPVGQVQKGKRIRIQVGGRYQFVASQTLGPDGFAGETAVKGLAQGVPCGALMGMIVSKAEKGKGLQTGKPFLVGNGKDFQPKEDGLLFFKVNAPAGHKSSGRIQVKLSGFVRKL